MKTTSRLACSLAVLIAVACGTGAIVATYSRLSHTWDEGIHLAAGLEPLQDGRYTYQTENPPFARTVNALIPYLRGARLPPPEQRLTVVEMAVDSVFHRTPDYIRNVRDGRLGTLLFFWALIALTWVLAGGRADPWVALFAAASIATLAPIVAHAGFATTDVAFVATFLLVLVALRRCVRTPSLFSATFAGAALGIAVATKFSTLVFLPPVVCALLLVHVWPLRRSQLVVLSRPSLWLALLATGAVAVLTLWMCYGFRIGRLADLPAMAGPFGPLPRPAGQP